MEVIFGTTSDRKISDLQNVIDELGLDYTVIGLNNLKGWQGEIEENGNTIEENSQIKADAIREFCEANDINLPIITDDAGLFVEVLGDEPGVKTSRYADDERADNPYLPDYQCVYKLLEYGLIEESGKIDLPGKPMSYKTTGDFLRMFGYNSLEDLPELPRYKLDENKQIVIDDLIEEKSEAPSPESEG